MGPGTPISLDTSVAQRARATVPGAWAMDFGLPDRNASETRSVSASGKVRYFAGSDFVVFIVNLPGRIRGGRATVAQHTETDQPRSVPDMLELIFP